jgi:hypothetical protein
MRVTVCELSNEPRQLARDGERHSGHVRSGRSDMGIADRAQKTCPQYIMDAGQPP